MELTKTHCETLRRFFGATLVCPEKDVVVFPAKELRYYFELRTPDGEGHYPVWSEAEIVNAFWNKAIEYGYTGLVEFTPYDSKNWGIELSRFNEDTNEDDIYRCLECDSLFDATVEILKQLPETTGEQK